MDLKLKHILTQIKTCESLRIKDNESGEEFYPNYADLTSYGEYYVIDIMVYKDDLFVTIQSQI
ncbi:hypothetical protein [Clostridium neonatale]|uniref:hypothetical protein n=1 Tax=Clostridium neonatale TaxID=137838 RepID=UPI00291B94F9|nr:hypothetical protein [Clostridium neonatale]CAI3549585.1 conserved hypothetical protein [Clostridium neonatale]CAI3553355.1 conserved hypothetical protein [Clostridium neonatale]CAI3567102.1 conserved hypothetical protein [Clostridium neonatale]CAI3568646.1 conserved hypothetical protein [Clostridium neonatale]CAI3581381.1 conserved hypothetical protein [Clostridium neonatale]